MEKKISRKKARQILTSISKEEIDDKSLLISKNIFSLIQSIQKIPSQDCMKPIIGAYSPIQQEVLWFKSLERNLKEFEDNFTFCIPHILPEDSSMEFYSLPLAKIIQGELGLELSEEDRESEVTPEILIIPGLAFTSSNKRLGRGKGFYDRYLNRKEVIKIGVCFEKQLFDDLPVDGHDQLMDYVITEKNIYNYKGIK